MNNNESKFYTTLQYQEYIDDNENYRISTENNKVFAKEIKSGYSRDVNVRGPTYYKYYIRIFPNRKLYDPFPKYSMTGNAESFIDKVCKSETSYKEVTKSVFDKYLNFLKTENPQWLKNAQKESNDL